MGISNIGYNDECIEHQTPVQVNNMLTAECINCQRISRSLHRMHI